MLGSFFGGILKLILENFKQYRSRSFDFPDKGICRIDGISGAGKSTVLKAINWAINGQERKIKPWWGGSPKVELDLSSVDLLITRTNTPNTLTVIHDGSEYKDDAAQELIHSVLGMDSMEFEASSYIKQDGENSILRMKPAEISKIIRNLSSKNLNPDVIINKIKELCTEKKNNLQNCETIYNSSKSLYDSTEIPELPVKPELKVDDEEMSTKIKMLSSKEKELLVLRDEITDIKTKENIEKDLSLKVREKENLIKEKESLIATMNPLPETFNEDESKTRFLKIDEKIKYKDKFNQLLSLANDINTRYPESKSQPKLSIFIEERIDFLTSFINDENNLIKTMISEIHDIEQWDTDYLSCPVCDASLKTWEEKLVLIDKIPEGMDEKKNELISSVKMKRQVVTESTESLLYLRNTISKVNEIKANIGPDPIPGNNDTVEALQAEQSDIKRNIESNKLMNRLKSEIEEEKRNIDTIKSTFEVFDQELLKTLELSYNFLESEITKLKDEISKLHEINNNHKIYEEKLNNYNILRKNKDKALELLKKDEEKLKLAKSEYGASEVLKKKSEEASSLSIVSTIDKINSNSAVFIDGMFPDDGTRIEISGFSVTQKGEERSKISIGVNHKGESAEFSDFSGGEKSRACLSFQLGLSEMFGSPLLMIDEGLEGVESEQKENCMSVVSSVAENKLVIVVEHGFRDSFFDYIINI